MTLATLGAQIGYSPQHLSSIELACTSVARPCIAALDADGALLALLLSRALC